MPAAAKPATPATRAADGGAASVPPPPPVPAALSGQTGYLLRMAVVHTGRWIAATVPDRFPLRSQEILQALADIGPLSQRELADLLRINPPLMVGLIDALDHAGLLERRRNPADRRSYALEPTRPGRTALAELNAAIDRAEAGLTAPLSAGEECRLGALLRTIIATDGWQPKLPEGLARRTGYLLESAHGYVRHLVDARLQAVDLTTSLYGPLATLAALGATSQQAIADRLGFTAAAIQQTVDRLEAARLVNRRRNPADRRAYALELTPAGRTLLRRAQRAVDQVNHQHLDHTLGGPEHNAELRETLRKLLHSSGNGGR